MKVLCEYSHLNGTEILRQNYPDINNAINEVIDGVVGEKSKISKEKGKKGKLLYSPKVFKSEFVQGFNDKEFYEITDSYSYPICNNKKKSKASRN